MTAPFITACYQAFVGQNYPQMKQASLCNPTSDKFEEKVEVSDTKEKLQFKHYQF